MFYREVFRKGMKVFGFPAPVAIVATDDGGLRSTALTCCTGCAAPSLCVVTTIENDNNCECGDGAAAVGQQCKMGFRDQVAVEHNA